MRGNKLPSNQRHGQETNQPTDNPFNHSWGFVCKSHFQLYIFFRRAARSLLSSVSSRSKANASMTSPQVQKSRIMYVPPEQLKKSTNIFIRRLLGATGSICIYLSGLISWALNHTNPLLVWVCYHYTAEAIIIENICLWCNHPRMMNDMDIRHNAGNHEMYMRRRRPDTLEVQQMKSQKRDQVFLAHTLKDKFFRCGLHI